MSNTKDFEISFTLWRDTTVTIVKFQNQPGNYMEVTNYLLQAYTLQNIWTVSYFAE